MILEPEQMREELSAVTNPAPDPEVEGGARKTETEAPAQPKIFWKREDPGGR